MAFLRLPRLPSGMMGPMEDRGLVLRASEAALFYELRREEKQEGASGRYDDPTK